MVGPLGLSARARIPCSFVAPRTCAVAAFVRPQLRTVHSGRHLRCSSLTLRPSRSLAVRVRLRLDLIRLAVRARSQRHLRYEYHCHQSNGSSHHRQHRRFHPAAVGAPLQILIARIRKENANTALLVTVHGKACPCGVGGADPLTRTVGVAV